MKYERLGQRNLQYNTRRRYYGNLPATDIDFMEYKNGKPVALIETKFGAIREIDLNDDQFEAMCVLADERIPVICCVYYPMDKNGEMLHAGSNPSLLTHIQFIAIGVNKLGRQMLPAAKRMSETEWVNFLCKLRDDKPNPGITLCNQWVPVNCPQITWRPIEK